MPELIRVCPVQLFAVLVRTNVPALATPFASTLLKTRGWPAVAWVMAPLSVAMIPVPKVCRLVGSLTVSEAASEIAFA